jgi:hypothetical protein
MKIRKQVYDLTLDDLTRYPVWEYALDEEGEDGQDEATVRPVVIEQMDLQHSSYMVRTRFQLAERLRQTLRVTRDSLPPKELSHGRGVWSRVGQSSLLPAWSRGHSRGEERQRPAMWSSGRDRGEVESVGPPAKTQNFK